jgi:hypothetical protein
MFVQDCSGIAGLYLAPGLLLFQQMFVLIAPHLLQSNQATQSVEWGDTPHNHLDPAIFKTRGKSSKKKTVTAN